MLVLWRSDFEGCPRSWAVELVLAEKGLRYEKRLVAPADRSPELLAVSPRGCVPALRDDEVALSETLAILQYLDLAHPEPSLMPAPLPARAAALVRLHEVDRYLAPATDALFHYGREVPRSERDPEQQQVLVDALLEECRRLEGRLAELGEPFLAGDRPTLPDFAALPHVASCVHLGLEIVTRFPKLAAWSACFVDRPSFHATAPKAPPPPDKPFGP